jgi:1,2-diacylglycerol 3-beta-galactosyltransferase
VKTKRAVFLIADTGGAHRTAAVAAAERLRSRDPEMIVDVVDPFLARHRFRSGKFLDVYGLLVRHFPRAWGWIYYSTNSPRKIRPVRALLFAVFGANVRALVQAKDVVMVGSFHALTTGLLARVVREMPASEAPRTFALVTDPVDVHAAWVAEGIETTLFLSEESRECVRHLLNGAETRIIGGFPVRKEFATIDPALEQRDARLALGLRVADPVVLVAAGGEGGGRVRRQVVELCTRLPWVQVVAVCGRNRRLLAKLEDVRVDFSDRLTVIGWSDQFSTLVKAADVVVSKSGPATITECFAAGVPIVITSFIPGQESGNPEWAARVGASRWAPTDTEMCDAVMEMIDRRKSDLEGGRRPAPATAAEDLVQAVYERRRQVRSLTASERP